MGFKWRASSSCKHQDHSMLLIEAVFFILESASHSSAMHWLSAFTHNTSLPHISLQRFHFFGVSFSAKKRKETSGIFILDFSIFFMNSHKIICSFVNLHIDGSHSFHITLLNQSNWTYLTFCWLVSSHKVFPSILICFLSSNLIWIRSIYFIFYIFIPFLLNFLIISIIFFIRPIQYKSLLFFTCIHRSFKTAQDCSDWNIAKHFLNTIYVSMFRSYHSLIFSISWDAFRNRNQKLSIIGDCLFSIHFSREQTAV